MIIHTLCSAESKAAHIDALSSEINSLKKGISDIDGKVDYLENQSRRSNIRISGLKEDKNESWTATEEKVKDLLSNKLNLYPEDGLEIERAHRTGKYSDKPRQVVVKFLRYKDRETVLQSAKKLKGSGIYINEDLSSRVVKRRQDQQEKLQEARKEGKIAYFSMDRLIVKPRPMRPNPVRAFGSLGAVAGFESYRDALQNEVNSEMQLSQDKT